MAKTMAQEIKIAIIGAVDSEVDGLTDILHAGGEVSLPGMTVRLGRLRGQTILLAASGVGKVNAAAATATLLSRFDIKQVWNIGSAGAYDGGPLRIGDVLITETALCGDEGILTSKDDLTNASLGFPLVVREGEAFFDAFPLNRSPLWKWAEEAVPSGWYHSGEGGALLPVIAEESARGQTFQLLRGPSLTVSMVSGDATVAAERAQRTGALAENMEGSAVAQVCFRFGVPLLECRGISNVAGDRRKEHWQLREAVGRCHAIVAALLVAL